MEVGFEGCLDMLMLCACCLLLCTLKHTHTHTDIYIMDAIDDTKNEEKLLTQTDIVALFKSADEFVEKSETT